MRLVVVHLEYNKPSTAFMGRLLDVRPSISSRRCSDQSAVYQAVDKVVNILVDNLCVRRLSLS
jgi:hypothetical protein